MPEISVVMPVFNGEQYIREAIDSIIAQTFTDWEFIIVNEKGSNEAVTAILREYEEKDPRIKVIQNRERLRIAASMNVGFDAAKGRYIARMDADDICTPRRLEVQYRYMEAHPEIDICGIKPRLFGSADWEWPVESDPDKLRSETLFFTPFVHPTIMIRAERLNALGLRYDPEYHFTEDYEFFERAARDLNYTNLQNEELYLYRMHPANATAVGSTTGTKNYRFVTGRAIRRLGVELTSRELDMLCIHTWPMGETTDQVLDDLAELDLLLKRIWRSPLGKQQLGVQPLFGALHKRWMRVWEKYRWQESLIADGRIRAAIDRGLFAHPGFYQADPALLPCSEPMVSIVIPTYKSEKFIQDTVYSLLEQTFRDFEMLIVNEPVEGDRTGELALEFGDPRIRIIRNETRLGLAESLNKGIRLARGRYIARADADDVYPPERLEKQVLFLENHPDISLCGSWQRHFGKRNYIHAPVETPELLKAQTIFKCDMCHSTVMFRKADFVDNGLFYDGSYLSEDFELWSRAVQKLKLYNIPEVLGEYRWDGENITAAKMNHLDTEAQKIVARTLKCLDMDIPEEDLILLSGWFNPFQDPSREDREALLQRGDALLEQVEHQNDRLHRYDSAALHRVLEMRRAWMHGYEYTEPEADTLLPAPVCSAPSFRQKLKQLIKLLLRPFKRPVLYFFKPLRNQIWDVEGHVKDTVWDAEGHVKDTVRDAEGHVSSAVWEAQDRVKDTVQDARERLENTVQDTREQLENTVQDTREQLENTVQDTREQLENSLQDTREQLADRLRSSENALRESLTDTREELRGLQQGLSEQQRQLLGLSESLSRNRSAAEEQRRLLEKLESAEAGRSAGLARCRELIDQLQAAQEDRLQEVKQVIWDEKGHLQDQFQALAEQVFRLSAIDPEKPHVFLFGVPAHANLGDHAQTLAILAWCADHYPEYQIICIPSPLSVNGNPFSYYAALAQRMGKADKVLLQGGLRVCDLYENELSVFENALKAFKNHRITVFPTTVSFQNREKAGALARMCAIAGNVTICARDGVSYRYAKELFSGTDVRFCPDIVHYLAGKTELPAGERRGVLVCKREADKECALPAQTLEQVREQLLPDCGPVDFTDTNAPLDPEFVGTYRKKLVEDEIRKYAGYKAVVTDRMHGMIFALLAGTPVVVLPTSTGKTQAAAAVYEAYPDLAAGVLPYREGEDLCALVRQASGLTLSPLGPETMGDAFQALNGV